MRDFSNITLVSVTGLGDAHGAALSLTWCSRQMPGASAVLFSPRAPQGLPPHIRHRAIAPLNYHEYSWFMMFALWKFVETDYVLIVQEDGWIFDMSNWRDEFLDYDYAGAPTYMARVGTPQGTYWMSRFTWSEHLNRADSVVMPVLNGGFCLRSRRMLRALIDHPQIRVHVPPPEISESEPIKMSWFNNGMNEDVQLSAELRPQLEAVGLRYAPIELSAHFAYETAVPIVPPVDPRRILGLHGSWRRLSSIDPLVVRYGGPRSAFEPYLDEQIIVSLLEERGYRVEFQPESR